MSQLPRSLWTPKMVEEERMLMPRVDPLKHSKLRTALEYVYMFFAVPIFWTIQWTQQVHPVIAILTVPIVLPIFFVLMVYLIIRDICSWAFKSS